MNLQAKWITSATRIDEAAPVYRKRFHIARPVREAYLRVTALGVYEACLNGQRVGEFFMAPGFTSYRTRLQVQEYDVTGLLQEHNELTVTVGRGWYHTAMMAAWEIPAWRQEQMDRPMAVIAELKLQYDDGDAEIIGSDESWEAAESAIRYSDLYGGEIMDSLYVPSFAPAVSYDGPSKTLIPTEGPEVKAQDRLAVAKVIQTPKGETVLDFGQNMTGVISVTLNAKAGEVVDLSFGEVLDGEGNFYNANYRKAKCLYHYICRDGVQTYVPKLTFYGFRYVRVNAFPGGVERMDPSCFTAVVMHSEMKRTGHLRSSDPLLNRFFENVIWGQKSNFLDIPTDCPQRDERMGWTGDIDVFSKAACLNFDVERFLAKWLSDLRADQRADGEVSTLVPSVRDRGFSSPAWGDAATIVPWHMFLAYGNKDLLEKQYESMCKWISYITSVTEKPDLWIYHPAPGKRHYGDWLGLDAPYGSYKGSSRDEFIGSAFYAFSTEIVIKAGRALGKDVSEYEALHERIVKAFRAEFPTCTTQTECVLAVCFGLAEDPKKTADQLAEMIHEAGDHLMTGFIGTPYLLYALSDFGHADLAWTLLLRKEYPSWLFPVTMGATTVWEHWDGIRPDGTMWSADMNSFNHYAYGSVTDWVYTRAAGIQTVEEYPGYERVRIAPMPDARLDWLKAELEARHGTVSSSWQKEGDRWRYEISTPVRAKIVIDGEMREAEAGDYVFYRPIR